jgi:hypothetical protein
MAMVEDNDVVSATGLALAAIAPLIERSAPVEKGEIARLLTILAESAAPDRPQQRDILLSWASLLEAARKGGQH